MVFISEQKIVWYKPSKNNKEKYGRVQLSATNWGLVGIDENTKVEIYVNVKNQKIEIKRKRDDV